MATRGIGTVEVYGGRGAYAISLRTFDASRALVSVAISVVQPELHSGCERLGAGLRHLQRQQLVGARAAEIDGGDRFA